jgi:hypothetical protein
MGVFGSRVLLANFSGFEEALWVSAAERLTLSDSTCAIVAPTSTSPRESGRVG